MPLSISRVLRRRAPATEADTAYAAVMKARRRRNAPSEAMAASSVRAGGRGTARFGFVLRGTLRHHPVRRHSEALGRQRALQHDFRITLERVGHNASVSGRNDLAVALHLEPVVEALAVDRIRYDEAMQLQLLAVPLIRLRHHLVDVLVVLGALGHGRVQQRAEGHRKNETGETDLDRFVFHTLTAPP